MTGDKKFSTASEIKATPPDSISDEIVLSAKDLKFGKMEMLLTLIYQKVRYLESQDLMDKDKIILLRLWQV